MAINSGIGFWDKVVPNRFFHRFEYKKKMAKCLIWLNRPFAIGFTQEVRLDTCLGIYVKLWLKNYGSYIYVYIAENCERAEEKLSYDFVCQLRSSLWANERAVEVINLKAKSKLDAQHELNKVNDRQIYGIFNKEVGKIWMKLLTPVLRHFKRCFFHFIRYFVRNETIWCKQAAHFKWNFLQFSFVRSFRVIYFYISIRKIFVCLEPSVWTNIKYLYL